MLDLPPIRQLLDWAVSMTREERALPLVGILSSAALDPGRWSDFVKALSETCRGAAVRLALTLPGDPPEGQHYLVGLEEEYAGSFLANFTGGLPWTSDLAAEYAARWSCVGEWFPDVDLRRTGFYQAWMKPQQLAAVWPMGMPILDETGLPVGGLTLFRASGGRAFRNDEVALGESLALHLRNAVLVRIRLSGVQRERLALAEVMDRLPMGVILLDRQRQPVVCNRAARQILATSDGFGMGTNGPFASDPHDNKALRVALDNAYATEVGHAIESSGMFTVKRRSGLRAYVCMAAPLLAAEPGSAAREAVATLYVADPDTSQISASDVLEVIYRLTPAEADLVRLLAEGHSLEEAAEARGVTMNTVRSQLKHVFAKTDTKRQGELVRLVLTGIATLRES